MTAAAVMDLNCDLGEGCGNDAALLAIVSSANIACGAHAGDAITMRRTVQAAVRNNVSIGAHVSYPDREGFGRRDMSLPAETLTAEVRRQLAVLDTVTRAAGARLRYIKAHGALYHRTADDAAVADAVIAAIRAFDASLALLTLPGSIAMERAQAQGLRVFGEAFADRAYTDTGRLAPRSRCGAVITDAAVVAQRAVDIAVTGKISSIEGRIISVHARSLCVHGDTPGAVTLARAVRAALEHTGVTVSAFT